jgi:hypothetical protein
VANFLDKNKDRLYEDLEAAVQGSASAHVAGLFAETAKRGTQGGRFGAFLPLPRHTLFYLHFAKVASANNQ